MSSQNVGFAGRRISHYKILSLLGAGGMGQVYRAHDEQLERDVAIKLLSETAEGDALARSRLLREARSAAALNHPHVCTIYEVGEADGEAYITMELIDGQRLNDHMPPGGLPVEDVLRYGLEIADAVGHAHERGIVHRDLKTANILVTRQRHVKVLDFGLAKRIDKDGLISASMQSTALTAATTLIGTLAYMAPEQFRGQSADTRSDVWALGVVLYEMAAGVLPFRGQTTFELSSAVLAQAPPRLPAKVPPGLTAIIQRCLEKEPAKRYQNGSQVLKALAAPMSAALAGGRRRTLVAAVAIAVVALAGGIYAVMRPPAERTVSAPAASTVESYQVSQLTRTGNAERAAISPDGTWVAYVQRDGGNDSLWIRQTETTSDVQIMAAEPGVRLLGATVTPDGSFVDFVRDPGGEIQELWRVPFLGGTRKRIVDHVNSLIGWSPDGRQMAFIRRDVRKSSTSLVAADPDGSNERVIAVRQPPLAFPLVFSRNGNGYQRPAWSLDGAAIALIGVDTSAPGRHPVVVDVATGKERVVPAQGENLVWLDAATLLLNRAAGTGSGKQLWRASYPDGAMARVTNDLSNYTGLSMTADRTKLVTAELGVRIGLWIGDGRAKEGSESVAPALGLGRNWPGGTVITWAGDRLVYPTSGGDIVGVQPERQVPGELIANGTSPASTTDGRTIVYVSSNGGRLWKADIDGRNPSRLIDWQVSTPVVTPDDRTVIFMASRNGQYSLWNVPLSGGEPTRLVEGPASVPQVSPDGKQLLYGAIDAQNPDGVMVLCDLPACTTSRPLTPAALGNHLKWTPDGQALAYTDLTTQSNVWIQPLDGGPPYQLTHFTDGTITDFAWSRNGKRLAVARNIARTTDIVLFKGLSSNVR